MVCSVIYEANERPRHATTTVAIRSKPIAPGKLGDEQFLQYYYVHSLDRFAPRGN
jgi:hypothetical protein